MEFRARQGKQLYLDEPFSHSFSPEPGRLSVTSILKRWKLALKSTSSGPTFSTFLVICEMAWSAELTCSSQKERSSCS